MSRTPEYRAVSNFFRNTQKLTPEELKTVVKEVIQEEVKKFLADYAKTNEFSKLATKYMQWNHSSDFSYAIRTVAQEEFNKHFDLKITKKEQK